MIGAVFLLTLYGGSALNAQSVTAGIVQGSVTSLETGEPLEHVNVFLSYTTIGTSTGHGGHFSLAVPRAGAYDIVFSLLGFLPHEERIELHRGDSLTLSVSLIPTLIETEPVDIISTPDMEWEKSLALFTRAIIGRSAFSRECVLLNPEVISFESRGDTLVARSDHLLRLENRALGYRLHLAMEKFSWNTARDYGHFVVYPYFEDLSAADSEQPQRWTSNRERAYRGSIRHFFRSLIDRNTAEQFFNMYSGPLIKLENGQGHRVTDGDFQTEPYETLPLFNVQFPGYIRIEFGEAGMDLSGGDDARRRKYGLVRPSAPPPRISVIRMTGSAVIVDSSGNLFDPLSIEVSGDWADRRIENLLPRD
ncbi:MAG TPA: carboxypeptidase-like regulatory domain-containing protein [Bacteroidota bacterium]|nr:carboxypeptidase-like regulatory domain-containing protein [Bacteroidota bacterium]